MIVGELMVEKFSEKRGQGKVVRYSNMITVKSGLEGIGGCYLSEKEGKNGLPVQFRSINENQLTVYFFDKQVQRIRFDFCFSPVATSNVYRQKGRFVKDGKFAPYWSCSFRKDKHKRIQAPVRKLKGIIEEIRFLFFPVI